MESNKEHPSPKNTVKKQWLSLSNLSTGLLIIFALAMFISPDFKGWTIQQLMKIGLFKADLKENHLAAEKNSNSSSAPTSVLFTDGNENLLNVQNQKGKVVFINFWATWCPPCIAEMPSIENLYKRFKDNKKVIFLLVDVDGNYMKSSAFMKDKKLTLPVYLPAGEIPKSYFSGSLPTTVILDSTGKMVYNHVGAADYGSKEVADFISSMLQ